MGNNYLASRTAGFFANKEGKIVIWQFPNVPLTGWILFKVLGIIIGSSSLKKGCDDLSMALLFTWAYLEITSGESNFRKLLGVIILIVLLVGYFR